MYFLLNKWRISSSQIIIFGFLAVILAGALLLTLPFSSRAGAATPFLDALFTSTSAVCVTGLVIHDTATYWSFFGQLVILLLIQVGGLGVVTMALSIAMFSGRRIGLMQRSTMQEAISAPKVGGIVRMTAFILRTVAVIELLGAAALSTVFCREFGLGRGLWYALFHSVSAFCNAGFDLMGIKAPCSSLTSYAGNPVVNVTIMALIVVGGLGFFTWEDVKDNTWRFSRYRMQTKAILTATAALILLPAVCFFLFEFSQSPIGERIWLSLFQAVTPRTAGFNTADLSAISEPGLTLMMVLMLIGGSPGSTAGGMKTTTLVVLLSNAFSTFRRKDNALLFHRRIPDATVKTAATLSMMYGTLFLTGGMAICAIEGVPLIPALYEAASAIGTVGLSLGLTPRLGTVSRLILIVLMYFGRVGGLTLVFAAVSGRNANVIKYPQENMNVG